MSRNGSGTYSVVNTFSPGTTITASSHNQNWSDIAAEMTNSVAADGQTSMTGPLKVANGTAAAPSVAFASDPDSGAYRIGANNLGVAVNGAKVLDIATTGLTVTGDVSATTVKQGSITVRPLGEVTAFAGSSAPSGWLLCYGQAISRTTYADLFAVIGTTFGTGDGSTTFNMPDLRGRVVAGKDDMGGSSANRLTNADDGLNGDELGQTGGVQTQQLVTENLPPYTPSGTIGGSQVLGTLQTNTSGTSLGGGGGSSNPITNSNSYTVNGSNFTFTGAAQGGTSVAFGVVQPTIILNYIIFAGV
jgi:microcystin-dependent protein